MKEFDEACEALAQMMAKISNLGNRCEALDAENKKLSAAIQANEHLIEEILRQATDDEIREGHNLTLEEKAWIRDLSNLSETEIAVAVHRLLDRNKAVALWNNIKAFKDDCDEGRSVGYTLEELEESFNDYSLFHFLERFGGDRNKIKLYECERGVIRDSAPYSWPEEDLVASATAIGEYLDHRVRHWDVIDGYLHVVVSISINTVDGGTVEIDDDLNSF